MRMNYVVNFFDYLVKWPVASIESYCPNSDNHRGRMSQLDCQYLCQHTCGCVGISYSDQGRGCYTCKDSILVKPNYRNYAFYKKPGDKQEALYYQKRNINVRYY